MEPLHAGDVIDARFILEAWIGQGGMGEVWRARQEPLGRTVALKLLRAEYSLLSHIRRRFAREARAAARLTHKNIASVFDFGTDPQGRMFIAMEFVSGPSLLSALREGRSVLEILTIADGLLQGLGHAHARGVVHRDLKPENVLLADRAPKIVDFGIATIAGDRMDARDTAQDQVVGTPLYMSPEQAGGERDLTPHTDLYSLGVILYEALCGFNPFFDDDSLTVMANHIQMQVPPLRGRDGLELPTGLGEIVLQALGKLPWQRFESAAKMRDALEPFLILAARDARFQRRPTSPQVRDVLEEDRLTRPRQPRAPMTSVTQPERPQLKAPAVPPRLLHPRSIPFTGREAERGALLSRLEGLAGQGDIVLVDGPAGVGKTRLAMWLKESAEEQGLARGHIGVFTSGPGGAARGVQEVLESLLRVRGARYEELPGRLAATLASWGAALDPAQTRVLLDVLRPVGEDTGVSASHGAWMSTLLRVVVAAARAQPRVLIFEDAHWAGRELTEFLELLALELQRQSIPVLVLLTLQTEALSERPETAARLQALGRHIGDGVARVHLEMATRETDALLRSILDVEPQLAALLLERSAGNPVYLIALTRYLIERGVVVRERGQWRTSSPEAVREAVPPTLSDLVEVRLRGLETRHRSFGALTLLLQRCALLGRRFSYEAVEHMLRLEGDAVLLERFEDDFDLLLKEGLITEVVGRGEEWYTFHTEMVRDVVLQDSMGPARRRKLHRLAAQALEHAAGAGADRLALEIAAHWGAARRPQEAIDWYWRGAQAARRGMRSREAIHGYTRVIWWSEQLLGVDESQDWRLFVLDAERFARAPLSRSRYLRAFTHVGDLYEGEADFDRAEEIYRRVVRMSGKMEPELEIEVLVPLCQAWLGLGHIAWQRGDFPAADWAFERVQRALERAEVAPDITNDAVRGLSRVAWHRGDFARAEALAEQARDDAAEREDSRALAESLWLLGESARMRGARARAATFYQESLASFEDLGATSGVARNLLSQAQLARYHKEFERAHALYERALKRYEALGDRRGQALCSNGLGEIARFQGNFPEALRRYLHALQILEAIGAQYDMAVTYTNIGLIELRQRRFREAEEYLSAALTLVQTKDYPYLMAGVEYNLALVKALRGKNEEADDMLRQVFDLSERVPMHDLDFAQPLEELGLLRAREGVREDARVLWERARDIYEGLGLEADLARMELALATLRDEE